jgi:CheY-like chemotaxis protein
VRHRPRGQLHDAAARDGLIWRGAVVLRRLRESLTVGTRFAKQLRVMLSQNHPSPGLPPDGDAGHTDPAPVLIVEDERSSRTALSRLLSQSGYDNDAVASAEDALQLIRRCGVPRFALVDLNLPGMSGLDLIEKLSRIDPSVVIVLTTAAAGEPLMERVRDFGVEYLRKPLDFNRLLGLLGGSRMNQ